MEVEQQKMSTPSGKRYYMGFKTPQLAHLALIIVTNKMYTLSRAQDPAGIGIAPQKLDDYMDGEGLGWFPQAPDGGIPRNFLGHYAGGTDSHPFHGSNERDVDPYKARDGNAAAALIMRNRAVLHQYVKVNSSRYLVAQKAYPRKKVGNEYLPGSGSALDAAFRATGASYLAINNMAGVYRRTKGDKKMGPKTFDERIALLRALWSVTNPNIEPTGKVDRAEGVGASRTADSEQILLALDGKKTVIKDNVTRTVDRTIKMDNGSEAPVGPVLGPQLKNLIAILALSSSTRGSEATRAARAKTLQIVKGMGVTGTSVSARKNDLTDLAKNPANFHALFKAAAGQILGPSSNGFDLGTIIYQAGSKSTVSDLLSGFEFVKPKMFKVGSEKAVGSWDYNPSSAANKDGSQLSGKYATDAPGFTHWVVQQLINRFVTAGAGMGESPLSGRSSSSRRSTIQPAKGKLGTKSKNLGISNPKTAATFIRGALAGDYSVEAMWKAADNLNAQVGQAARQFQMPKAVAQMIASAMVQMWYTQLDSSAAVRKALGAAVGVSGSRIANAAAVRSAIAAKFGFYDGKGCSGTVGRGRYSTKEMGLILKTAGQKLPEDKDADSLCGLVEAKGKRMILQGGQQDLPALIQAEDGFQAPPRAKSARKAGRGRNTLAQLLAGTDVSNPQFRPSFLQAVGDLTGFGTFQPQQTVGSNVGVQANQTNQSVANQALQGQRAASNQLAAQVQATQAAQLQGIGVAPAPVTFAGGPLAGTTQAAGLSDFGQAQGQPLETTQLSPGAFARAFQQGSR